MPLLAARERGASMPLPEKTPSCTQKLALWGKYNLDLARHYQKVCDYAADYTVYLEAGLDVEGLAVHKRRLEISKQELREARKRYADHIREHGCEISGKSCVGALKPRSAGLRGG